MYAHMILSLKKQILIKNNANGSNAPVFAEMPNEQFKQLKLSIGDKVKLKIRQAHWFH